MHCAPFLLTMQIIFASVSYRRVVADLRNNIFTQGLLKQADHLSLIHISTDQVRMEKQPMRQRPGPILKLNTRHLPGSESYYGSFLIIIISVSYTHLDVYKRQGCTPNEYRKSQMS